MNLYSMTMSGQDEREFGQTTAPEDVGFFKGVAAAPLKGLAHSYHVGAVGYGIANDEKSLELIERSRLDPAKYGTAANILYGLTSVMGYGAWGVPGGAATGAAVGGASSFVAGGVATAPLGGIGAAPIGAAGAVAGAAFGAKTGAAASIGYLSAVDKFLEMKKNGVDDDTALSTSGLTGVVMGVGAALPAFVGNTLAKQVGSGVVMNVGLGGIERAGTAAILERGGYAKMAEQYKVLDGEALAVDALLGAIFPLGGRFIEKTSKYVTQDRVDAAITMSQVIDGSLNREFLDATPRTAEHTREAINAMSVHAIEEGKHPIDFEARPMELDAEGKPVELAMVENERYGQNLIDAVQVVDKFTRESSNGSIIDIDAEIKQANAIQAKAEEGYRKALREAEERTEAERTPEQKAALTEVTRDYFARKESEAIAQAMPDMVIDGVDGSRITVAEHVEVMKDMEYNAKQNEFLHALAVSCALTYGV